MYFGEIKINFYHNENARYLSGVISEKDTEYWVSQIPIIISAQTDAGKNYFIQNVLLEKIASNCKEGNIYPDKMLILSIRIALNRKTKKEYADALIRATGNEKYEAEMRKYYTSQGVDDLFIDLDPITICSYHQLFQRRILDNKSFKYIVCDECHFFTSDAIFNPDTNEILKYIVSKGEKSIRIYMSATPEVAVEAIIREEFNVMEDKKNEVDKEIERYKKDPMRLVERYNRNNEAYNAEQSNIEYKRQREITGYIPDEKHIKYRRWTLTDEFGIIDKKPQNQNHSTLYEYGDPYIEREDIKASNMNLTMRYYNMKRDYSYVSPIEYTGHSDLLEFIKNKAGKWIIFTKSEKNGEKLNEEIKELGKTCEFLSSSKVSNDESARKLRDSIIEKEGFDLDVLLTTSLLDNGINITDEKVTNIAIEVFDYIEFIQMLGRIRINSDRKINVYIKKFTLQMIKEDFSDDMHQLMDRLDLDTKQEEDRKVKASFNDKFFRVNDGYLEYNPCAIYQLISTIGCWLYWIRKEDPKFCYDSRISTMIAKQSRIYNFYRFNGLGEDLPWSRSIIDIIESREKMERRKNKGNELGEYGYMYTDNFRNFVSKELIFGYYEGLVDAILKQVTGNINTDSETINRYTKKVQEYERGGLQCNSFIKYQMLIKSAEECREYGINIPTDEFNQMKKRCQKYLSSNEQDETFDAVNIQLSWIGRQIESRKSIEDRTPILEEAKIEVKFVTKEDVEKNVYISKNGNPKKDEYNRKFLENNGVQKGSDEAKLFEKIYLNNESLMKHLEKGVKINGVACIIKSGRVGGSSKHETYYFLQKLDNKE